MISLSKIIFMMKSIRHIRIKKKYIAIALCTIFSALIFFEISLFSKNTSWNSIPIILVYHDIREPTEQTGSSEYVTSAIFERQMAYLAKNGFSITSITKWRENRSNSWRNIILTFDDTWKSQHATALPILQKYSFGATFFINSAWVGKEPFLTWDAVRTIATTPNMEIGGHSSTHAHFLGNRQTDIWKEIADDKQRIEKEISMPLHVFSYPYGEYNKKITALVKKAGYLFARTIDTPDTKTISLLALPARIAPNSLTAFTDIVTKVDYKEEREQWEKVIHTIGGSDAYTLLKKRYAQAPHHIAHNSAHVFGEVLYKNGSLAYLPVCDGSFIFGCYHGFLGKVISERGIKALPDLDAICNETGAERLGCHHGIGHGIINYFGEEKLKEALDACASLSWKKPVGGCTGGLFMEYNFRNAHLEEGGNTYVRPYTGDPYTPCTMLSEKFRRACFYEQPDWWRRIFKEDYKKLGELCSGVNDVVNQEFCFIGTGRMAAQSMQYDKEKTILECARMPTPDAVALCRAGGFLSIFDYTGTKTSLDICNGLIQEKMERCLEKSQLFIGH